VRLRLILMTTIAMIFGMLPMAIGLSDGGEQNAPMGRAVIGGIITSTLLTLVVVPVLYTYLDTLGRWFSARLAPPRPAGGGGAEAVPSSREGDTISELGSQKGFERSTGYRRQIFKMARWAGNQ
jgi:HAE1 family hydrophobic/amphiphilic exporter-1